MQDIFELCKLNFLNGEFRVNVQVYWQRRIDKCSYHSNMLKHIVLGRVNLLARHVQPCEEHTNGSEIQETLHSALRYI